MFRAFLDFWINPGFRNYDTINIVFYGLVLCCGAMVGSLVSIAVISTITYGSLHLLTGRLRWALPSPVKAVYFACCGFFAAELIAAMANPSGIAFNETFENLPVLGLAGVYSITFVDRLKLVRTVETTAFTATIAALGLLLVWYHDTNRAELAAGNASVLALLGSLLYVLNCGAAFRRNSIVGLAFGIAAAAAAYIVIMTGTRAMWPVLLVVPFICSLCFLSRKTNLWGIPCIFLLGSLIVILAPMESVRIKERIASLETDLHAISDGDFSGSIGQRVQLYNAGYDLFFERPFLGYGPGNERAEIAQKTAENGGTAISYSHAHNAVLTAALRAGILGVAALLAVLFTPWIVALRARKDEIGWVGLYVLSSMLMIYLCSGTVGIALGHDIHDTVYIAGICYGLYLVFGRTPPQPGDHRR
ncbi:O-antigen ligase family protein [Hoeflea sp.]|uniref:O-antigen ligase family protein n=1 Tax=Hoeflea sp. TaxID=1940281 RepID=UPI00374A7CE3